jgi:NAD(P)-dependent dehydrogenase (short-subunit alcohol dehydrogenase family)
MSTLKAIPQPLSKLQGKVAVITGATAGIGLAAAKLFVREGAYVFIMGRRQTELDDAVKTIGSNVTGVKGDVAKLVDLDRLYESNFRRFCSWRNASWLLLRCSDSPTPHLRQQIQDEQLGKVHIHKRSKTKGLKGNI